MKKIDLTVAIGFLLSISFAHSGWASSFTEKCPDIPSCAKFVGDLLGQNYIFESDTKGKVDATSNLAIDRDNAELLFTNMLHLNGYTRVPLTHPQTYEIIRERDARDTAIPVATADAKTTPRLPNTWDLYTLKYKATHADSVELIARMIRSFLPATARVIPSELGGVLMVTASAPELKSVYETIRDNDQKPTSKMLKDLEERQKTSQSGFMKPTAEEQAAHPNRKY